MPASRATETGGGDKQRIDKWLWHVRVVRTRTAAAALAARGHVRINGERADAASRPVRVGDVVTVALERGVRVLRVLGFTERRGSPTDAAVLYKALEAEEAPVGTTVPAGPGGRPDKRARRALRRVKAEWN